MLLGLVLGAAVGALFGVSFGAFASVFHNGPELVQGMTESWPWFCALGAFMGFGVAQARLSDAKRAQAQ
ncbi:MAG: hypothetical protein AAF752_00925 [Bacteroidota bacterium]